MQYFEIAPLLVGKHEGHLAILRTSKVSTTSITASSLHRARDGGPLGTNYSYDLCHTHLILGILVGACSQQGPDDPDAASRAGRHEGREAELRTG